MLGGGWRACPGGMAPMPGETPAILCRVGMSGGVGAEGVGWGRGEGAAGEGWRGAR